MSYYFGASYRRRMLDSLQNQYSSYYKGVVLDIGGRDRGRFQKPRSRVKKWIFADIEQSHNPDIVLNVESMPHVKSKSIDVVNAMELFEHVAHPEKGIKECFRVLKSKGTLLISVPFLIPVHADPYDYQRWTHFKWKAELEKAGFRVKKIDIMGRFFTVYGQLFRDFAKALPLPFRYLFYLFFPIIDLYTLFDRLRIVTNHKRLGSYHQGYFIIAQKTK